MSTENNHESLTKLLNKLIVNKNIFSWIGSWNIYFRMFLVATLSLHVQWKIPENESVPVQVHIANSACCVAHYQPTLNHFGSTTWSNMLNPATEL